MTETATTEIWQNCFDGNWQGMLVPEAMGHPAKFARGLIERIVLEGSERGWWKPGDVIGDPFGGVATGGLVATYAGLRWVGVELEPKFVALGNQNIDRHRRRWEVLGADPPRLVQGDSRQFAAIVGAAAAVVTSPPYNKPFSQAHPRGARANGETASSVPGAFRIYGETPGQIEGLPQGDLSAVITSPPYAETKVIGGSGYSDEAKREFDRTGQWPKGDLTKGANGLRYGTSAGQIGETGGDTYWQAMRAVYLECRAAIKPGGFLVVNVKDYVQDKKRFPLCARTLALLTSLGFAHVATIHAMLVKEQRSPSLFGGEHVETSDRKSFFRRVAEKKGSPRIDHEEIIVVKNTSEETA